MILCRLRSHIANTERLFLEYPHSMSYLDFMFFLLGIQQLLLLTDQTFC